MMGKVRMSDGMDGPAGHIVFGGTGVGQLCCARHVLGGIGLPPPRAPTQTTCPASPPGALS
jgi:hypothetical protein